MTPLILFGSQFLAGLGCLYLLALAGGAVKPPKPVPPMWPELQPDEDSKKP